MDEATWAALAATLTVAGAIWTWVSFRRRGAANGLRALAVTLLPAAAWLTGTLEMLTEIAGSVSDWAASLVFDPRTWAGIAVGGLAVVLWVVSGVLRDRQLGRARDRGQVPGAGSAGLPKGAGASGSSSTVDDDLADIEAILRKRGIE